MLTSLVMIKRTHKQNCSLAFAADIVSERWTLLIVRELLLKPCRYGELLTNREGMGTNLLASRLKELATLKLIEKNASRYQLTPFGRALEPSVLNLIRWGLSLLPSSTNTNYLHRNEWDILAMKALFNKLPSEFGAIVMQLNITDEQTDKALVAWIEVCAEQFKFGFDQAHGKINVHWTKPLALLSTENPEQYLDDSAELPALSNFLAAFKRANDL